MSSRASLLKVSEVAKRAGVSVDTVGFYVREGLLPRPTLKTSRNMAWYDESFVERTKLVRRLQQEQRMPLREIKALLDELDASGVSPGELSARAAGALALRDAEPRVSRRELQEKSGLGDDDLEGLERARIVGAGGEGTYGAVDVAIAELVAKARGAGLEGRVFPVSDLAVYREAMSSLVEREIELFLRRTRGGELSAPLPELIEAVVPLLGQLMLQLRRKAMLEQLVSEGGRGSRGRRGARGTRGPRA